MRQIRNSRDVETFFFLSVVTGISVFSIFPRIYWGLVRCRFRSPHAQLKTEAETPGPEKQGPSVHGGHCPGTSYLQLLQLPTVTTITYCSPELTLKGIKEIKK